MVLRNRHSFLSLIKESHHQREWTDVHIRHNGETGVCHKFVLGTASSFLHDIFTKTSNDNSEIETIIFDTAFEYSEVEDFLSYVYGVTHKFPLNMVHLFSTHLQVKPDIKPEPDETSQLGDDGDYVGLWNCDDWTNGRKDVGSKYDYGLDDDEDGGDGDKENYDNDSDFINDEDEDEPSYKSDRVAIRKSKQEYKKNKIVTTENGMKKYECRFCGELVHKMPRHVTKYHPEEWEEYNRTRKVVNRKKQWPKKCPHEGCETIWKDKWHYDRHIIKHTDPKERKARIKKEKDESGCHVCSKCGEEFPTKSLMKAHEYKHKKSEYICDVKDCNEMFLSRNQYTDHMLFKHQRVIQRRKRTAKIKIGEPDENQVKEEQNKHLCPQCGKGFVKKESLNQHVMYNHSDKALPVHTCNVCGKQFKTNHKLENHILLHEPPTKKCPFCDKMFETDHKRKKHIKANHIDDSQKLYKCSYCSKGFDIITSYQSHMNDHKNIRPYNCHLCDKAYRNSFDLQQHVRKTHGITSVNGQFVEPVPQSEPPDVPTPPVPNIPDVKPHFPLPRPGEYPHPHHSLGEHLWSKFS